MYLYEHFLFIMKPKPQSVGIHFIYCIQSLQRRYLHYVYSNESEGFYRKNQRQ